MGYKTKLKILNGTYQLTKLPPNSEIPSIVLTQDFFTISRTSDELSIIALDSIFLESEHKNTDWKIIQFVESMDLSLVGITAKISTVLAQNNVNMCALATYNTDYILVKRDKLKTAIEALENAGYEIV